MGYDFASAVADLVDNSIAAQATLVAIDVEFDGDESWVRITDNGVGMPQSELKEAMRYGAERAYDANDLGKFGLGLKTASMSQCQRLSVASRVNPHRTEITAFCWDLEHIEKTNRWEILTIENSDLGPAIRKPLKDNTGTVVLWQKLDRVLGYKHPYSEAARKRLLSMCREVEAHLGMVFHRFLSGEVPGKHLKILVNGNPVQPWDPYCRKELNTQRLSTITVSIEQENNIRGQVELEPFILPHQEQFSSLSAFVKASGPAKWNRQQGFYIYRANRMIQSGGWSSLRTLDEHTKLARVALSFSPNLDEAFKINVAKMRVQLPAQLREEIQEPIAQLAKIARETYSRTGKKSKKGKGAGVNESNTKAIATKQVAKPQQPIQLRLWSLDDIEERLRALASHNERLVLAGIFRRLRRELID
jgi:uncharacterized tellurite resistance protein B-like protein